MKMEKVGDFIRKKRKDKNLTQKELAKELGVSDNAISKWERGICCPDISLLKELSSILGVSVNELLSGEDIEKLEKEKTDDVLIDSVKQYTSIEKKKNKKLLIFTIILLLFYIGLVFAMYLTFNQVNKTNGLTWETIENKKLSEKLYTALENYDYEELKNILRKSLGYKETDSWLIEDENNCEEPHTSWGLICRVKDFENEGIKFVSHKYMDKFYGGGGKFGVQYEVVIEYEDKQFLLNNITYVHNGAIEEVIPGFRFEDPYFQFENPKIYGKLIYFFNNDGYYWDKKDY